METIIKDVNMLLYNESNMTIVLQNKLVNIIIAILFCKTGNM